ncbi:MAG TPA: hypothetical protein VML19_05670 [Verrucomicrobiae bacterium]|nr:hypothetical protein [Verrucomicrobiae bacterium]
MNENTGKHFESVLDDLRGIIDEFTREVGRKPSSGELFEILTWGVAACRRDAFADLNPKDVKALTPEFRKGGAPPVEPVGDENVVYTLNDEPFNAAADLFHDLIQDLKKDRGKPPTLAETLEVLADVLHECTDCLADHRAVDLVHIKPEVEKTKRISYRKGDIVAIPTDDSNYFLAIILTENRFGMAVGLFHGARNLRPISRQSYPPIEPRPIYSDPSEIRNGRWKIIGHDEELLSLFPRDPEIYHYSHADFPNPDVDPFGAGESPSGKLRKLTREEAEEVGLPSLEYRQSYLSEDVGKYLKKRFSAPINGEEPKKERF